MTEPALASPPRPRIDALDAARGAALAAMALYHATWDLGFLQLTPENYALTGPGHVAAHLIAGSFLTIVGIGLWLANGRGLRWRPFLARLARIGGAALAITAATWWWFPDAYIFFGVLHCIAVASLLALPFLRLPALVTALVAAAVVAAPFWGRHALLEEPVLSFLGLRTIPPRTNDYVPLFPWFGLVLLGLAAAKAGAPRLLRGPLGRWQARSGLARAASFAGRHSLAIYLVHQPLLLAILSGIAFLTGPHPRAGLPQFQRDYAAQCERTGGSPESCRIAARCTGAALRREGLWGLGGFTPLERQRAQALSQDCYEAATGNGTAP
ncbi:DUF1624 domain-containing protein [Methylobacterium organophilum]|uniref:heparan-alpha-glucosaminide N-acetyltransferase n=1 Tax=Methylobacterium organophilum TaxID=410 RepID=UPI001F132BD1|nr:heparan-alpha-glucosaminide N-acetyltransferase [Methylobacterium organophilum]UMY15772.1 DUF1624 domain-containing protein [Methylobacterium organophilum]